MIARQSVLSRRPWLERLEDRLVCSGTRVTNTSGFPFRAVAYVSTWYDLNRNNRKESNETWRGSAVMIGPNTALTSAHVVYDASRGGFAKEVTIRPGQSCGSQPFGSYAARNWVVTSAYKSTGGTSVDLAVLNFSTSVGHTTGWFGYQVRSDSQLRGMTANNIGYPGAPFGTGEYQYLSSGPVRNVTSNGYVGTLEYSRSNFSVSPGSSGSPIYAYQSSTNSRNVVGIHSATSHDGRTSYATRITSTMASFIGGARGSSYWGGVTYNIYTGSATSRRGFLDTAPAARLRPVVLNLIAATEGAAPAYRASVPASPAEPGDHALPPGPREEARPPAPATSRPTAWRAAVLPPADAVWDDFTRWDVLAG